MRTGPTRRYYTQACPARQRSSATRREMGAGSMRRMLHPVRRPTGLMVLGCVVLVSALLAARPSMAGEPTSPKSGREDRQAGRLQPRGPADPVEELLRLPWLATRRSGPRGCGSTSERGRQAAQERRGGHRSGRSGFEQPGRADQRGGRHPPHAAAEGGQSPQPRRGRCADALGPAGSEVCRALGLDRAQGGNRCPKVNECRLAAERSGLLDSRPPGAGRTASLARGRPVHPAASGQPGPARPAADAR